ncbi:hypothetical protein CJF30_00002517 [Rutstroemia sp. NJR-2017a BBW]|nr:hypothetical protein CJF30_00002517 [Rutstroemia sp. NJR-2017a BBW]
MVRFLPVYIYHIKQHRLDNFLAHTAEGMATKNAIQDIWLALSSSTVLQHFLPMQISDSANPPPSMTLRALAISAALFIAFVLVASTLFLLRAGVPSADVMEVHNLGSYTPILPELPAPKTKVPDPVAWLKENSDNKYAVSNGVWSSMSLNKRPKAALISLVRNSELEGIRQSMMQLEMRWNHKYQYPWIFFNDEPFSEEFKAGTRNLTAAKCYYEVVPKKHWSLPEWIDEARFMNSLEYLGTIGVGKGWMVSYHHMCRWNSGFFYRHPALADYEWYWRVEPDVHYFCDINYDIFRFMRDNNLKYGFNMNILDDARSFPSLWSRTLSFMRAHPQLLHPSANLTWLLDSETHSYNNCQYFSNFEIGSLAFWRGAGPSAYFDWLDRAGGFYYERFGDAPVHTLSVGLFAERRDVWYFADVVGAGGESAAETGGYVFEGVVRGRLDEEEGGLEWGGGGCVGGRWVWGV